MVMILPEVPSFGKQFAQSLGRGIESGIGEGMHMGRQLALEKYKRGLEAQQNLAQLGLLNQPQDFSGLGAQKPSIKQASASIGSLASDQEALPVGEEELAGATRPTLKRLSADEIESVVANRVNQAALNGVVINPKDVREQLLQRNQAIKSDIEEKSRYENLANELLTKQLPEASDETIAAFARYGSRLATEGKSDPQIKKELASKASQFAEIERNVKQIYKRQKGFGKLGAYLSGSSKDIPEQISALKKQIRPLLDMGLFQEARTLAKSAGFGAEETELAISNLGEDTRSTLATMPNFKTQEKRGAAPQDPFLKRITPEQYNEFELNLSDVLQNDPRANLILLRSEYMKKGVDWRSFNDAIQKLVGENQQNLTRKQQEELAIISQPPLSRLDQLLYDFGLRGK